MTTIKQRIEGVTENVTDGKVDITGAITNKGVSTSSSSTFSNIALAISKLNVEKVSPPTVDFNSSTKILTLSNTITGATNEYKLSSSSSWITYTSPVTLNTFGNYDFRAYRNGSVDSDIITQELEDLIIIKQEVIANGVTYDNPRYTIVLPSEKYFTFQALPNVEFDGTVHLEYSVSGGHGASIDVPFGYSGSLMAGRATGYGSATLKILTPENAIFEYNNSKQVTFSLAYQ